MGTDIVRASIRPNFRLAQFSESENGICACLASDSDRLHAGNDPEKADLADRLFES